MAPAHPTRVQQQQQQQQQQQRDQSANPDIAEHGLFLEPMMGTPLAMYVHRDVPDHDRVVDLIMVSSLTAHRRSIVRLHNFSSPRRGFVFIYKITPAINGCWNDHSGFPLGAYIHPLSSISHPVYS